MSAKTQISAAWPFHLLIHPTSSFSSAESWTPSTRTKHILILSSLLHLYLAQHPSLFLDLLNLGLTFGQKKKKKKKDPGISTVRPLCVRVTWPLTLLLSLLSKGAAHWISCFLSIDNNVKRFDGAPFTTDHPSDHFTFFFDG